MSDKGQLAVITVEPPSNASLFIAAARGARCFSSFNCMSKSLLTFGTGVVAVKLSNIFALVMNSIEFIDKTQIFLF